MKQNRLLSVEEVAALLRDMQDAEGVAFLCAMFDVRGEAPSEYGKYTRPCACPIARLAQTLTGIETIQAGRSGLMTSLKVHVEHATKCGKGSEDFIEAYDNGKWPELVEAA